MYVYALGVQADDVGRVSLRYSGVLESVCRLQDGKICAEQQMRLGSIYAFLLQDVFKMNVVSIVHICLCFPSLQPKTLHVEGRGRIVHRPVIYE